MRQIVSDRFILLGLEPFQIFDPRRNFQLQGFTGRGATTTLHDASATGVSVSGIFQAAEDFAALGLYNAYDYFNHLRLKHLPCTNLSGLALGFDLEYDNALDGAMRFDAAKYPSVAWDAITFVCGVGGVENTYEVPLLAHATVLSGGEMPASATVDIEGAEPAAGVDIVHLHFRDTRYTVAHPDCRFETQLGSAVQGDATPQWFSVADASGLTAGDEVWIERTGLNEELVQVLAVAGNQIQGVTRLTHPSGGFVTRRTSGAHVAAKLASVLNASGEAVSGRFGPDQSTVLSATAAGARLTIRFRTSPLPAPRYGKIGNTDRILVTSGHDGAGTKSLAWSGGDGSRRFTGGDNDTRYRIGLDFRTEIRDRRNRVVPMNDCRKIYMVFAPRFERIEEQLEDGCFLAAAVEEGATTWAVDDTSKLSGGRYFVGDPNVVERVLVAQTATGQVTVVRGYEGTAPRAWPAGTRMSKLCLTSGFSPDVEWRATISNIAVEGHAGLKVAGGSARIEESDARCKYTGYWEDYKYGTTPAWPSQWWSAGHAKRTAPNDAGDLRKVVLSYSQTEEHELYLGTFLNTDCGRIRVSVDGVESEHDLYLDEYGGTVANVKVRGNVPAGIHTVEITALFDKHAASAGYYFYFDYLWPLVPQDVPDAPEEYSDVSLAIDFDTDHGYKKPPAWHVWQLQKLGFKGHADVYMGVFWNNKRQRVGATYPYATVAFSGTPAPGDVVWLSIAGTTIAHAIGYGETLQQLVSHFRAAINGMFSGVWADDGFGTSTTLRIQSKAPGYTFSGVAVSAPTSVTLTLSDHLGAAGDDGDWEIVDAASPVMTEGVRRWIRDLAGQFAAAGIPASFAFSMEAYNPPAAMRAKYLRLANGAATPGEDVYLEVPSHQMHFGARVGNYMKQMYRECADEIAAAGLPVVLQFGETQWWYFDNRAQDPEGGMGFYDQETIDAFQAAKGHPIWPFVSNTDDPAGDPAHPYETADFLRDRIWAYCQEVIAYVRAAHPGAQFECLWPLDANQGKPAPDPGFRRLLMHVNLPDEWKDSSRGIKYFRSEAFDYDVWQKNANLMRQAMDFPSTLGRPSEECMYLAGIYGPPDPLIAQAYHAWRTKPRYSLSFWALDQFCLNSRPVPLPVPGQFRFIAASYHKLRVARGPA